MTTFYNDYISDLQGSLTTPLLIEVQNKHIDQLKKDIPDFSEIAAYENAYNAELYDVPMTNVITINAQAGKEAQIFSEIYHLIGKELRNKLLIDSALKFSIFFTAQGIGDIIGGALDGKVSESLKEILHWCKESLGENLFTDKAKEYVVEKPAKTIADKIEDVAVFGANKANSKQKLGRKLHLNDSAQASLKGLAVQMSGNQTPHQAMQFLLDLLNVLGKDAPKLIVINNPFNLDAASLSLLSLYFSHAKDLKQKVSHTEEDKITTLHPGVSVLFNYTEQQPFDTPTDDNVDIQKKLTRLRHMVQRYGMLEKVGASIPIPAVRASSFVGRSDELDKLSKEHYEFIEQCQQGENQSQKSQLTLIKGEPGTGKTALVKKHLDKLYTGSDKLASSQVRLKLLNQTGHSSEVTGLASLQDAIQAELVRLTQLYQIKKLNIVERQINDKRIEWEKAEAQFGQINVKTGSYKEQYEALKANKTKVIKSIEKSAKFILGFSGFGSAYDGAKSLLDGSRINQHKNQIIDAQKNQNNQYAKQEQFDLLTLAIKELQTVSKFIDKQAVKLPLLLFVDDFQWIDELAAEFILAHLLPAFPTELLFTARGSDSETSYKLAKEGQKHSPYKLALFDAAKLSTININSKTLPNTLVENKLIMVQPEIVIKGMGHKTLSVLLNQTV
ncbi:ATP-binding protein, partial [Colwellia sp. BRX8-2]|uniref:AAA family ATPase n=1 Tax=Colwellia sp. BRX8-2 TaxID=2759838 RepID=UPI0015F43E39